MLILREKRGKINKDRIKSIQMRNSARKEQGGKEYGIKSNAKKSKKFIFVRSNNYIINSRSNNCSIIYAIKTKV